jgi:predicted amidohydrolase
MRLALAQLDSRLGDLEANRERAKDALAEARGSGADLVVFPELQLSGYAVGEVGEGPGTACGADSLASLAAHAGEGSVLFGFHEASDGCTYNSAAYYEAGRLVHVHRKLHLPAHVVDESALFAQGDELRAFDTSFGRSAVLICYDAWHLALPFLAVHDGARILLVPASSSTFVAEAEAYWHALTRLYGSLLQCFVVFVNRVGDEAGLTFWGGSHVVDPRGDVVAAASRFAEELLLVDIDLAQVDERRLELPLVTDPRIELLRAECERLAMPRDPLPHGLDSAPTTLYPERTPMKPPPASLPRQDGVHD